MLIVTPPYVSLWPPMYWWTRWWLFQSPSSSAHGGPNPKMFGVLFHAAIHNAFSGTLVVSRTDAATSRMPEHRLLYIPARYPRAFSWRTQPSVKLCTELLHAPPRG